MNKRLQMIALSACLGAAMAVAQAGEFDTSVPMHEKGAATYYVPGQIDGLGEIEMMVDTGSGYLTINEQALNVLQTQHHARYVKKLRGVLANGTQVVVPVYAISVNIGGSCMLHNVEAAVFPGKTRFILGLNVLKQAAPFIFSTAPPKLVLSNCDSASADKSAADALNTAMR